MKPNGVREHDGFLFYIDENNAKKVFRFSTFKDIDPKNSYKINYTRQIANAVNLIMGRFHYFYNHHGKKPQTYIILSSRDMARNIGGSKSQAANVFQHLADIFGFDYSGQKAHKVILNSRFIEFLSVFTERELQSYIMRHNITGENIYRLEQVFKFRMFHPHEDTWKENKERREAFYEFMTDPFIKNYHHYCSTSNRSDSSRIATIEENIDVLSNLEKDQLSRIKKAINNLGYYLHKLLIKLDNKISWFKRTKEQQAEYQEQIQNHSQTQERNHTEAEQEKTRQVGSIEKRDPEDNLDTPTPRDVVIFATYWNYMSHGRQMKQIHVLTKQRIKSIMSLVKYKGRDNVLHALGNLRNLFHDKDEYIEFMNFSRFVDFKYFDVIAQRDQEDTRLKNESNYMQLKNNYYDFWNPRNVLSPDNVPDFENMKEATSWFQSRLSMM